jgi:ribose 5-phosphate isomerase B
VKTIAIGCDPNATALKKIIIEHLEARSINCKDFGSDDPIYANVAITVAEAVAAGRHPRGILLCGTGIGVCLAANKVPGAYAATCTDPYSAERSVLSNNCNIMTIGSLATGSEVAKKLVDIWIDAEYVPGGRSEAKIQRIYDYAKDNK